MNREIKKKTLKDILMYEKTLTFQKNRKKNYNWK